MGYTDLDIMDETSENRAKAIATALLRALQPAIPAVIGAAALTFLFAAVMPFSWVAGISWNLYLDRLSNAFAGWGRSEGSDEPHSGEGAVKQAAE